MRQAIGPRIQFAVAQPLFVEDQRNRLWPLPRLFLETLLQGALHRALALGRVPFGEGLPTETLVDYATSQARIGEPMTLDALSELMDDQQPRAFYDYIRNKDYGLSPEIPADKRTLNQFRRFTGRADGPQHQKTRRPTETFSWLITPLGWHARSVPGTNEVLEPAEDLAPCPGIPPGLDLRLCRRYGA